MAKTTVNAVETWELTEILAALCQVAQDAADDAHSVPEVDQKWRIALDLPLIDQEGSRP
jgi:hypothetical protein